MALARNSLLSLVPTVAVLAISIITVPLYISIVGTDRYGALLIAWVIMGYFGQADLGLGRAITQKLAGYTDSTAADRARVVYSALAGAAGVSLVGAILIFGVAWVFFAFFFQAEDTLKAEAMASAWLFAPIVPVIMLTGVSAGALTGMERFAAVSLGSTVGNVLSPILPLAVAVLYSPELPWLILASLIGRALGLSMIVFQMWRVLLVGHRPIVSSADLKSLFGYGSWIMVSAIVGPLMLMSDRVIIGATISAVAVVAYSVPFQIAQRTVLLPYALLQALFPRLASQTAEQSVTTARNTTVLVGQIYAFVVLGIICCADPLLRLWLGDALDPRSVLVGQIAMLGFWLNAVAGVPFSLIQARGNSRFTALVHLFELPIYFGLLYVLGMAYGLYGIVAAFALRNLLDCGILFAKARIVASEVLIRLASPAAIIVAGLAVSQFTAGWIESLIAACVLSMILLPVCWLQMSSEARQTLEGRLPDVLRRNG